MNAVPVALRVGVGEGRADVADAEPDAPAPGAGGVEHDGQRGLGRGRDELHLVAGRLVDGQQQLIAVALGEARDERAGAVGVAPAGDLIGGDDEHASSLKAGVIDRREMNAAGCDIRLSQRYRVDSRKSTFER